VGIGKVDKLALFKGEFHPLYISPLAASLLGGFKVVAGYLYILTEYKEVKVIGEANCNIAYIVLELSI
jgi:hypothetical protein